MNDWREIVWRAATLGVYVLVATAITLATASVMLPRLGRSATSFVAMPGGFVVAAITILYLSKRGKS